MRVGGGDTFRLDAGPAGLDQELRIVLEELTAGRWVAMRTLLARTGTASALRTARTQVLAAVAAGSDVVTAWRREEPESVDALVMSARVAVERALQAHRLSHRSTGALERDAREVCWLAARQAPADPVPWVCLLALAQLDAAGQREEHRQPSPDPMLVSGPWGLLNQAHRRDPYNREAFHRMLGFFARGAGSRAPMLEFARWVGSWARRGSPLLVLPLYAYVENFRYQWHGEGGRSRDPLMRRQWASREYVVASAANALEGWFDAPQATPWSATDLNHLAHALWAGTEYGQAARVFLAIGPHATWAPWACVSDDPADPRLAEAEFLRARTESLNISAGRLISPRR